MLITLKAMQIISNKCMERSEVQEFDILTKVRVNRNLKLTKHS